MEVSGQVLASGWHLTTKVRWSAGRFYTLLCQLLFFSAQLSKAYYKKIHRDKNKAVDAYIHMRNRKVYITPTVMILQGLQWPL